MKGLLAVLLASISLTALADTWVMQNNGGGQIVLTDRACKGHPKLMVVYSYTNKGYWEGCWTVIDGNIHVVWMAPNGSRPRNVYPIGSFTRRI